MSWLCDYHYLTFNIFKKRVLAVDGKIESHIQVLSCLAAF